MKREINLENKKPLILVVEDEENTLRLLEYALVKSGYTVYKTRSGREALEYLLNSKPAAIILDIVMPDMDGYSFLRSIKSDPEMKDIPVIISSGKSKMKNYYELEDEKYKPDAFLIKPYKMEVLIETVKKVLRIF